MMQHRKPTREEIAAAHGKRTVPDIVGPGLRVLFVGINPGLYSGATGTHFARPGNRFWPALHRSGLTPRQLHPSEEGELLEYGLGIINLVERATATAAELEDEEVRRGGARVKRMVKKWRPRAVCFLGVGAYRQAYGVKRKSSAQENTVSGKNTALESGATTKNTALESSATREAAQESGGEKRLIRKPEVGIGVQPGGMEGAALWVLPNPSGLNANHQMGDFVRMFGELREAVGE